MLLVLVALFLVLLLLLLSCLSQSWSSLLSSEAGFWLQLVLLQVLLQVLHLSKQKEEN